MSEHEAARPADGTTSQPALKAFMRRQRLFANLSEEDLARLLTMATLRHVPRGESFIEEGAEGSEMYIVVEGDAEIFHAEGASRQVLAVRGEGDVIGEMALLGGEVRTASVRALTPLRLLVIDKDALRELLSCSPSAAVTMVRTVTSRLRSSEAMLVQQEKLASLGTMAAGLAHELNNPASAVGRGARQLERVLERWQAAFQELAATGLDGTRAAALDALMTEARTHVPEPEASPLVAMQRETALTDELLAHGVEDAYEIAPALLAAGWHSPVWETCLAPFDSGQAAAVARAVGAAGEAGELLREAGAGAEAISSIVGSVKSYVYLDQAPVQEIDVIEGLESTLVMLRHELKEGVRIERELASDLPRVSAHGSELNQVWTNLIDNAVAAMNGSGTLRLRAYIAEPCVVVEICDDGQGIPSEVLKRVFDPFFTTKPLGEGTGLGLHIAHTIVRRHRGRLTVTSQPGDTCFRVELPVGG